MTIRTAILSLLSLLPAHSQEVDPARMIAVLAVLEGGKWSDEGGAAHLSYSAWTQHSRSSYQLSRTEERARVIYRIHLAWILAQLKRDGAAVTPENCALAWRFGVEGSKQRNYHGDYGRRAQSLYSDSTFK